MSTGGAAGSNQPTIPRRFTAHFLLTIKETSGLNRRIEHITGASLPFSSAQSVMRNRFNILTRYSVFILRSDALNSFSRCSAHSNSRMVSFSIFS